MKVDRQVQVPITFDGLNFHKTLAYFSGTRNDNDKPDRKTLRTWFTINVIDQIAHVASLYAIVNLI